MSVRKFHLEPVQFDDAKQKQIFVGRSSVEEFVYL
jgi:hypothetical protein